MRWDIRRVEVTGSTNEDAFALGRAGVPAGAVVVAGAQRAGRGRMDRAWFSPPGKSLYCSVLLRPSLPLAQAGLLSFCSAVAMADAVRSFGAEAFVKWPNDVLLGSRKICGILSACDGLGETLRFAVVGSGLNLLAGSYPEELRGRAACLQDFGFMPDRDVLLHRYLDALDAAVSGLEQNGFSPLRGRLRSLCLSLGRPVRVSGAMEAEGVAEDIGEAGELLLRTAEGELLPVFCGDVSVRGVNGYV